MVSVTTARGFAGRLFYHFWSTEIIQELEEARQGTWQADQRMDVFLQFHDPHDLVHESAHSVAPKRGQPQQGRKEQRLRHRRLRRVNVGLQPENTSKSLESRKVVTGAAAPKQQQFSDCSLRRIDVAQRP